MRNEWRIWCGLIVLLLAGLWGCGGDAPLAEAEVGQRVADKFLAQIREGQVEAAWQSTSAEFKSDEGRESFVRDVKSKAFLRQPMTFVKYEVGDLNGLKRGQCFYESPASGKGPAARLRIVVGQDAGEWRVDGMFVE